MKKWFEANPEKKIEYREKRKFRQMANRNVGIQEWVQVLYNNPCFYCGGEVETIDHATPISRGGTDDVTNLTGACRKCNSSKGNKTLFEFLIEQKKEAHTGVL